ncbi:hypothetical protein [Pseudomonas phage IR-QUMS-PaBa1-GHS-2021]|uniref:hypothetical protein n=1 Tax=Pseudomonas aeruginosa TaxID=287 RepID=UPI0023778396|nr:hypothetical protein [Pseudomonas aeruginosa]MDH1421385.1 hypothetical protein [Pseudomonas aeruginosa]UZV40137.1 hypothetical protein [Pseudomonas phage IR-QUMS-PaBa1-GHS-2021]
MTSTVNVTAHCTEDKEVVVRVQTPEDISQEVILQNGEKTEVVVFGAKQVIIHERTRLEPEG